MMSFLSPSTEKLNPLFLLLFLHFIPTVNAQVATGQSDRTQQELALLGWTAGVRSAYCQQASPQELIPIFRESIARMLNRHCRNPSVCGLKKPVTFTKHQVVLLDGFPRREYRALSFRFFVVLPHEAIPLDKKPDKPLLSSLVLSEMLDGQMAELTHGLGWQVLSREKYPRFDPTTTFFNRSLILIAVIAGLCMIFLAYWVSSLTSGSSLYADGWLVRGSSGGKNAALRRTMEIIEEQKYRFALYDSQKGALYSSAGVLTPKTVVIYKTNARVQEMVAPPKSLATSYSSPQAAEVNRAMPIFPAAERKGPAADHPTHHPQRAATSSIQVQPRAESVKKPIAQREQQPPMGQMQPSMPVAHQAVLIPPKSRTSLSTNDSSNSARRSKPQQQTTFDEQEMAEMGDCVPEIVVMHARDSSMDTVDTTTTPGGSRKLSSSQGDRRKSRRFSIAEEFKRRKSFFGGSKDRADSRARGGNQQERQKRWKASSIALSKFSIVGSSGHK